MGTPIDRDKLATIGVLRGGRTRDRITGGRAHPDSGLPFKSVTDQAGNTVTEHGRPGTGVSARQDVQLCPETVTLRPGR